MVKQAFNLVPDCLWLPIAMGWVRWTLRCHAGEAIPMQGMKITQWPGYFRAETLNKARLAIVTQVPMPPLMHRLMRDLPASVGLAAPPAITLRDTIFLCEECSSNGVILFHELVHVVQWAFLGDRKFLKTYLRQLMNVGYQRHPLEEMAGNLYSRFQAEPTKPFSVEDDVRNGLVRLGLLS